MEVNVRENIERLKGQIQYLEKSSDLGTLTIYLSTEERELPIVEDKWDPLKTIKAALRNVLSTWQFVGDVVLWLLFFLIPLIPLVFGFYLVYKLIAKILKKK